MNDFMYGVIGYVIGVIFSVIFILLAPMQLTPVKKELVRGNPGYYDSYTRDFKLKECK